MRMIKQSIIFSVIFLAVALLFGTGGAIADPLTFTITSFGSFDRGDCRTCTTAGGIDRVASINSNAALGSSTIFFSPAAPGLGSQLLPGQTANVTLGSLQGASTALPGTANFTGATLTVTFSITLQVDPNQSPVVLTGSVTGQFIQNMDNPQLQWITPTTLTFDSPQAGTFTLTLPPITDIIKCGSITGNSTLHATLTFNNGPASIPEPTSLILLGTGLFGLAGFASRKSKSQA